MSLPIAVSQRAKRDVQKIWEWIAARSSSGADSWLTAFEECLSCLQDSASASMLAPESEDLGVELRQRLFKTRRGNTYRLVFMIQARVIYVVAVRGTGQDLLRSDDIQIEE